MQSTLHRAFLLCWLECSSGRYIVYFGASIAAVIFYETGLPGIQAIKNPVLRPGFSQATIK